MPVTYTIDTERRVVVTVVEGTVTMCEMREYQAQLRADPQFQPDFAGISDFQHTTPFAATGEDIRELTASSPFGPGSRRAFVVAHELHFGLARMAQMYSESLGVEVAAFRNRDEALKWLGIAGLK